MKHLAIAAVTLFGLLPMANAEDDRLVKGCKAGAQVTQEHLGKSSSIELTRLGFRCVGGVKNRPSIREEYNRDANKNAYACGLGIGAAAAFYGKQDLLQDTKVTEKLLAKCEARLK